MNIGLLGFGVVGGGVLELTQGRGEGILYRWNLEITFNSPAELVQSAADFSMLFCFS